MPDIMLARPEFMERFLKQIGRDPNMLWVGHAPSPEEYMKGILDSCAAVGLDPKGAQLLHVGAHLGQEDPLYTKAGIEPCYVEANPNTFNQLTSKLRGRKCWNRAAGEKEGRLPFYVYNPDECSSFFKRSVELNSIYPHVKEVGQIGVRVSTVDSLMKEYGKPFDIVVIDTQGAELSVLKGATEVLKTAKVVMCELYHEAFYAGSALSWDVDAYMAKHGFTKYWEAAGSSDCWGDAVYIRR
jgi:FkbM family methyltransferase